MRDYYQTDKTAFENFLIDNNITNITSLTESFLLTLKYCHRISPTINEKHTNVAKEINKQGWFNNKG